jgi:hypothetical protein
MTAQAETHDLQYPDKPTGRATTYTPATAELIAARLADGETLSQICRTPGMPARQTVQQWRMRIPAFADLYARAREIGMEAMSDDMLVIADDDTGDVNSDGTPNSASVQRARLQVDTRKFLLAKLAPRVYGDRQQVEISGTVEHAVTVSDRERMRRLATFLAMDARLGVTVEGETEQANALSPLPDRPALTLPDAQPDQRLEEPRANDDEI